MKDIDFDELDRAVSSLLGKPGGSNLHAAPAQQDDASVSTPTSASSSQDAAKTATTPSKPSSVSAPTEKVPAPTTTPTPISRPPAPAPQAAPRFASGRIAPNVQPRRESTKFPITPSTSQDFNTPKQQPTTSQNDAPSTKLASNQSSSVKPQVAPVASQAPSQPKPNVVQKPLQNSAKLSQKPPVPRPRSSGNRFMDVVHPAAPKQPGVVKKPAQQPVLKKPALQPQSSKFNTPSAQNPPSSSASPSVSSQQAPPPLPHSPITKRTGVMGTPSMPSRVSHAGKTIASPKPPKPSSFVDSLIPKLRQTTQKSTSPQDPALLGAPKESKKLDEGHREELLTAQAGRPADERQRRIADEIPSPFLTHAKVEKRPLGGGSVPSGASQSSASTVKQTLDAAATRLDQQAEDRSFYDDKQGTEDYPAITDGYYDDELGGAMAEFDQDVVAAEAMEPNIPESDRPDTPPAYPPEQHSTTIATTNAPQPSRVAGAATMSIPQQYRAKTAAPDKTPRSIYDTEEYHKPLPTAASKKKKTHPIVWILLIVLLLAVGAGLGVAAYFLVG